MASDNFAATNNPLASPWTSFGGSFGGLKSASGGCSNAAGSDGDAGAYYSSSSSSSSQVDYVSGTMDGGPALNMGTGPDGYVVTAYDGAITYAFRLDDGAYSSELGHATGAYVSGQPVKMRRSGNDLITSLNGSDILTVTDATYTTGSPGIFAYAGNLVFDNWTDGVSSGYTLTASQGSYALSGQTTGLRAARNLSAAQGSYSLSGQSVGLNYGHLLSAAQGSYSLSGQAVTLTGPAVGYSLTVDSGVYSLVGSDAAIDNAISISAGSYALSGQDVGLAYGHKVPAAQGSYTLSGQQLAIRVDRRLALGQGSYALSGQDITLTQHNPAPVLTAETGSYALIGNQVGLINSQNSGEIFHSLPLNWWTKGL